MPVSLICTMLLQFTFSPITTLLKTQDEKDAAMDSITANLYNKVIPN